MKITELPEKDIIEEINRTLHIGHLEWTVQAELIRISKQDGPSAKSLYAYIKEMARNVDLENLTPEK